MLVGIVALIVLAKLQHHSPSRLLELEVACMHLNTVVAYKGLLGSLSRVGFMLIVLQVSQ